MKQHKLIKEENAVQDDIKGGKPLGNDITGLQMRNKL